MMARSRGDRGRSGDSSSQGFVFPFGNKPQPDDDSSNKFSFPFGKKQVDDSPSQKFVLPFSRREQEEEKPANFFEAVRDKVMEIRPLQVFSGFLIAVVLLATSIAYTGNAVGNLIEETGSSKVLARALQFGTIYESIKDSYLDKNIDLDAIFVKGVNAMLGTLDPYSEYETEKQAEDLNERTSGRYAGVGITISKADDKVLVVNAFEGYAYSSGIRPGDRIVKIDDKTIDSKTTMDDVQDYLRGEPGTTVALTVKRDGSPEPTITVPIRRQIVRLPDVKLVMLDKEGVGYLKLDSFSFETAVDTERAIRLMQSERELKGLVLDLRDNPGGVLDSSIAFAQQLVPEGTDIVSTEGRLYGDSKLKYRSNRPPLVDPKVRIVVLVNGGTASAAEIVTGVIQDTDRGVIVGERTYGKGLVQVVSGVPGGGSLKLTVAKYFTPSGRSIQAKKYGEARLKASATDVSATDVSKTDVSVPSGTSTVVQDTEKKSYVSISGRKLQEGGGILPDVVIESPKLGELERSLIQRGLFYEFAGQWLQKNAGQPSELARTIVKKQDNIFQEFVGFVRKKSEPTATSADQKQETVGASLEPEEIEKDLDDLEKMISSTGVKRDRSKRELAALRKILLDEELAEFATQKKELQTDVVEALLYRLTSPSTRLAARLTDDPQVKEAQRIASDPVLYAKLLEPDVSKQVQQTLDTSVGRAALFPP